MPPYSEEGSIAPDVLLRISFFLFPLPAVHLSWYVALPSIALILRMGRRRARRSKGQGFIPGLADRGNTLKLALGTGLALGLCIPGLLTHLGIFLPSNNLLEAYTPDGAYEVRLNLTTN
ncbi:unnamed protein product [Chrysoparadoxa australica]